MITPRTRDRIAQSSAYVKDRIDMGLYMAALLPTATNADIITYVEQAIDELKYLKKHLQKASRKTNTKGEMQNG